MTYKSICISSGHGKYVKGAVGVVDEVTEARRVTNRVAEELRSRGVEVVVFHDDTSKDQGTNLNTIVNAHNKAKCQLDVSVHFNAFNCQAHGVEVCYLTQKELAAEVSAAIASVGFTNRGPKHRTDLKFLNATNAPAILIETAFCDNSADVELYQSAFDIICSNIADVLGGEFTGIEPELPDEIEEIEEIEPPDEIVVEPRVEINVEGDVSVFVNGQQVGGAPPSIEPAPPDDVLFYAKGKCSYFGGPDDTGVSPSEGLAFHYKLTEQNQHLFLPLQPSGTTGLARRLNAQAVHYVAARWAYHDTPKEMLAGDQMALVTAVATGLSQTAFPADWGPAGPESDHDTGRVADLSPALMRDLGLVTDDLVIVEYPWRGD